MENSDNYTISILDTIIEYTINFFNIMWAYSEYCIDHHMV